MLRFGADDGGRLVDDGVCVVVVPEETFEVVEIRLHDSNIAYCATAAAAAPFFLLNCSSSNEQNWSKGQPSTHMDASLVHSSATKTLLTYYKIFKVAPQKLSYISTKFPVQPFRPLNRP